MKVNKTAVVTGVVAAALSFLAANTIRDISYINNNAKVVGKLSDIVRIIRDYSIYQPDDEDMSDLAASALAYAVNDPYTMYFDKKNYRNYLDSVSSSYFGIGVMLSTDVESGIVTISECTKDGPSEKAGVMAGDILLGVDDNECNAQTIGDVISYIKSRDKESNVTLHIKRGEQQLDIAVALDTIQSVMVTGEMLDEEIGYIKIDNFERGADKEARTAYDDFMDSINELRDSGMQKLVIDLRNNPGGDLGVVTDIADEFLDEGTITYTEDKNGKQEFITARTGGMDYPAVIITNGNSASASEVLTAALKDNGKATVVGEKTYGKGVVQRTFPLSDETGISVTVARYFTPAGICIHGIGIEPDVQCSLPEGTTMDDYTTETDPQILKAVEVLKQN